MPVTPHLPRQLCGAPFRGSEAVAGGLITPGQLRSRAWRRLFHDVYVDASVNDSHLLRIKAAALRLPAGAVITGRSAAHLWGAELAGPRDPVDVLSPTGFGPIDGLCIRRGTSQPDEVVRRYGVPLCTPLHTAWEIARTLPLLDAIGWLDALARQRRLSTAQIVAHAERHRGERDSRQAAVTLPLADPRAESPPESRLRVCLIRAGLPAPQPQWSVYTRDGLFIARVDLAWPGCRFAVEYDGRWHADPGQLGRDRDRVRNLNAAGWYVYPVTAKDMHDLPRLVANIGALLARRG